MKRFFLISFLFFQAVLGFSQGTVVVSGLVRDQADRQPLPYVTIILQREADSSFVTGTITLEDGLFKLESISAGDYVVKVSFVGFEERTLSLHVGRLSTFLDMGTIFLRESATELGEVTVTAVRQEVSGQLDKKVYNIDENISQLGGSVLQALQNLPGVTIDQEGKLFLRGSDKVAILLDGKQTAITGMGSQSGLENIPASAIERIEIINNPSARYDASGMAGIVNIVFRKQQEAGWNGRAGFTGGLGALSIKRENLPEIREQYRFTPKLNPSLSANYRKNALNFFFQGDLLWHRRMMKNEYFLRDYDSGVPVRQQFLENRTQPIYNLRTGLDWMPNSRNSFTFSGLFNYRAYVDLGDLPYFNATTGERIRLWQYYEDEVNQTLFATLTHKHSFREPGHILTSSFNYSFRRKDEVFYFTDTGPLTTGSDTTGLIADENIFDLTVDYLRPMKKGRLETGTKQRARIFPNDIFFRPGLNSILDPGLQGTAEYREWLSAVYGNYIYELKKLELEAGLRLEYAQIDYLVDPDHSVYSSDGFSYFDLFPNVRASWLIDEKNRLTGFFNRRVDRPEESDLRVFPTYADPEILVIGNPTLQPQFTRTLELGYRRSWNAGYIYAAVYHRLTNGLITRILTVDPSSNLLTSVPQNADIGTNSGMEWVYSQSLGKVKLNANANYYRNVIGAFIIVNAYPENISFDQDERSAWSGNVKLNMSISLGNKTDLQVTGTYLAPDIIPQGRILARGSVDAGLTREIQKGKGELFVNATDIFNTLTMRTELEGTGFQIRAKDYYETQVIRLGYQYRF